MLKEAAELTLHTGKESRPQHAQENTDPKQLKQIAEGEEDLRSIDS